MKEYFVLQFKMANRTLRGWGINPIAGYLLGLTAFAALAEYLFYKTGFAPYIIALGSISIYSALSEKSRTDFLLMIYGEKKYRSIRLVENMLVTVPFAVVLVLHTAYLPALLLLAIAALLSLYTFNVAGSMAIPTPFYKKPFEFAVGFRHTFYLIALAYALTAVAVAVGNYNLGLFDLLLTFLTCFSYYTKPEHEYYVWVYAATPGKFLFEKIRTAVIYSACLALPVLVGLLAFYPQQAGLTALAFALGPVYIATVVLAKYSAYPAEINIPEVFMLVLGLFFPPVLLALIPFFYSKSLKKLSVYLK